MPDVQPSSTSTPLPDSPGYEIKVQDQSDLEELVDSVEGLEKQQYGLADLPMEILESILELLSRNHLLCESNESTPAPYLAVAIDL